MKLESDGILISLRPLGERDSVAQIFTREHGVLTGLMRAAQIARKNRPLLGQVGSCTWVARLDSQLGAFHWEAAHNMAAPIMYSPDALAFMTSAFDLISALVPEREGFATLYNDTMNLMSELTAGNIDAYLQWEISFLRELGYALDLTHCSGCGATENLNYLSPRTGRAVCESCAQPYLTRLYALPLNLTITGHFLDSVCASVGTDLPFSRRAIVQK